MKPMYQTVLFDFDGTLVSSLEHWLAAYKHTFAKFGKNLSEEEIIEGAFYRDDAELVAKFDIACARTFWDSVSQHLTSSTPIMFPGVRDVLEHLAKRKIPIGLVTSGERDVVERSLKHLEIGHYFSTTVTANDISNFKPHPEPVLKALSQLKADPKQTLFVGDYVVDVKAGKAAGTSTALYFTESHSRFHNRDHLEATEPDFMFSDYKELLARLSPPVVT